MKQFFLLLCSALAFNFAHAQDVVCQPGGLGPGGFTAPQNTDASNFRYEIRNAFDYNSNQNFENLTHIADAQFQTARITLNGNPTLVSARYNPMTNNLQIKDKNKIYNIVKANNLEVTFVKSNQTYRAVSHIADNGEIAIDYFVFDATTSQSDLLKKVDYKYIQPKLAQNSYGVNKPAKLKKVERFFVMNNSNTLVELSTKKKSILKDFPNNSKLILAFIKDHKIKSNKEDNLKLLANYIVSLQPTTNEGTLLASNKP